MRPFHSPPLPAGLPGASSANPNHSPSVFDLLFRQQRLLAFSNRLRDSAADGVNGSSEDEADGIVNPLSHHHHHFHHQRIRQRMAEQFESSLLNAIQDDRDHEPDSDPDNDSDGEGARAGDVERDGGSEEKEREEKSDTPPPLPPPPATASVEPLPISILVPANPSATLAPILSPSPALFWPLLSLADRCYAGAITEQKEQKASIVPLSQSVPVSVSELVRSLNINGSDATMLMQLLDTGNSVKSFLSLLTHTVQVAHTIVRNDRDATILGASTAMLAPWLSLCCQILYHLRKQSEICRWTKKLMTVLAGGDQQRYVRMDAFTYKQELEELLTLTTMNEATVLEPQAMISSLTHSQSFSYQQCVVLLHTFTRCDQLAKRRPKHFAQFVEENPAMLAILMLLAAKIPHAHLTSLTPPVMRLMAVVANQSALPEQSQSQSLSVPSSHRSDKEMDGEPTYPSDLLPAITRSTGSALVPLFTTLVTHPILLHTLIERYLLQFTDSTIRDSMRSFVSFVYHSLRSSSSQLQVIELLSAWLNKLPQYGCHSEQLLSLFTSLVADHTRDGGHERSLSVMDENVSLTAAMSRTNNADCPPIILDAIRRLLNLLAVQTPALIQHPLREYFKLFDQPLQASLCNPHPCHVCHAKLLERAINPTALKDSSNSQRAQAVMDAVSRFGVSRLAAAGASVSMPPTQPPPSSSSSSADSQQTPPLDCRVFRLTDLVIDSHVGVHHRAMKLMAPFVIPILQLRISELSSSRASKHRPLSSVTVYFSNYSGGHCDVDALGLPFEVSGSVKELTNHRWTRAKIVNVEPTQREVKVSFSLPVHASYLLIHYSSFHGDDKSGAGSGDDDGNADSETVMCPRCIVPCFRGVCLTCHENAYQCRYCRNINYDHLNAFLCNECGHCRSSTLTWTLMAAPSNEADEIRNEAECQQRMEDLQELQLQLTDLQRESAQHVAQIRAAALQSQHHSSAPSQPLSTTVPPTDSPLMYYMKTVMSKHHSYVTNTLKMIHSTKKSINLYLGRSNERERLTQALADSLPALTQCHLCTSSTVRLMSSALASLSPSTLLLVLDSEAVRARYSQCLLSLLVESSDTLTEEEKDWINNLLLSVCEADTSHAFLNNRFAPLLLSVIDNANGTVNEPLLRSLMKLVGVLLRWRIDNPPMNIIASILVAALRRASDRRVSEHVLVPLLELISEGSLYGADDQSMYSTLALTLNNHMNNAPAGATARHPASEGASLLGTCALLDDFNVRGPSYREDSFEEFHATETPSARRSEIVPLPIIRKAKSARSSSGSAVVRATSHTSAKHSKPVRRSSSRFSAQSSPTAMVLSPSSRAMAALCDALGLTSLSPHRHRRQPTTINSERLESLRGVGENNRVSLSVIVRQAFHHWNALAKRSSSDRLVTLRSLLLNPMSSDVRALTLKLLLGLSSHTQERRLTLLSLLLQLLFTMTDDELPQSLHCFTLIGELWNACDTDRQREDLRRFAFVKGLAYHCLYALQSSVVVLESHEHHPSTTLDKTVMGHACRAFGVSCLIVDMVAVDGIRQALLRSQSCQPVSMLVTAHLRLSSLLLARTSLTHMAAAILASAVKLSLSHSNAVITDGDKRLTIKAYIDAFSAEHRRPARSSSTDKSRSLIAITNELLQCIVPVETSLTRPVILRKSPSQEEYIRGEMKRSPYQITEFGGARMSDIVATISRDLHIANDANMFELLVAGKIINRELEIEKVFDKVWKQHWRQSLLARASQTTSSSVSHSVMENYRRAYQHGHGRLRVTDSMTMFDMHPTLELHVPAHLHHHHQLHRAAPVDDDNDSHSDEEMREAEMDEPPITSAINDTDIDVPPMLVIYRLTGLDGEATEPRVDTLPDDEEQNIDPEIQFSVCQQFLQPLSAADSTSDAVTGIQLIIDSLARIPSLDHDVDYKLSQSLIKLLEHCCQLHSVRHYLASTRTMSIIDVLTQQLTLSLQSVSRTDIEEIASVTNNSHSNDSPALTVIQLSKAVIALIQCLLKQDTLAPSQSLTQSQSLQSLLRFLDNSSVRAHPPLITVLLSILPSLTRGSTALIDELAKPFLAQLHLSDATLSFHASNHWWLESFAVLTANIPLNDSVGAAIRQHFYRSGLTQRLIQSIEQQWQSSSNDVNKMIESESLPLILSVLTGLVHGHSDSQTSSASLIPILRLFESVSSATKIGSLSEHLLAAITVNNRQLEQQLTALRDVARQAKMKLALQQRAKLLSSMGFKATSIDSPAKLTADIDPRLLTTEVLSEESNNALRCCICDGTQSAANGLLGIYVYVKLTQKSNTSASDRRGHGHSHGHGHHMLLPNMDDLDIALSTVTHFTVIHFKCHADSVRADRKLKPPKSEWEGAKIRNAHTKCNALLPIYSHHTNTNTSGDTGSGNDNSELLAAFNSAVEVYFQSLPFPRRASYPRYLLCADDLKSLLLRFATNASFSEESLGGGRESNMALIVFLLQLMCQCFNGPSDVTQLMMSINNQIIKRRIEARVNRGVAYLTEKFLSSQSSSGSETSSVHRNTNKRWRGYDCDDTDSMPRSRKRARRAVSNPSLSLAALDDDEASMTLASMTREPAMPGVSSDSDSEEELSREPFNDRSVDTWLSWLVSSLLFVTCDEWKTLKWPVMKQMVSLLTHTLSPSQTQPLERMRSLLSFIFLIDYLHSILDAPPFDVCDSAALQSMIGQRWTLLAKHDTELIAHVQRDLCSKLTVITPAQRASPSQSSPPHPSASEVHVDALLSMMGVTESVKREYVSTMKFVEAFTSSASHTSVSEKRGVGDSAPSTSLSAIPT